MHCYCCDILVSPEELDTKTGRYYCGPCFEPTNEELLSKGKPLPRKPKWDLLEELLDSVDDPPVIQPPEDPVLYGPMFTTAFDGWDETRVDDVLREFGVNPNEYSE